MNVVFNGKFNGSLNGVGIEKTFEGQNPNTADFIMNYAYSANFADLDNDEKYDTVFIEHFSHYIVSGTNSEKLVFKDSSRIIRYDDYENVAIYKAGARIESDKIQINDVASIAVNSDLIRIYIQSNKIDAVALSKGEDFISVDIQSAFGDSNEDSYPLDRAFNAKVEIGTEYRMYLSYWGNIVFLEKQESGGVTSSGRLYAYMKSIAYDDDTEKGYIRLYTLGSMSGTWETYNLAEKVIVRDGSLVPDEGKETVNVPRYKLTAQETAEYSALNGKPQLIVYGLNDNNEISRIEIAMDVSKTGISDKNVFHKNATLKERLRTYHQGWVAGGWYAPSNAINLLVPSDRNEEKKYGYGFESFNYNGSIPEGSEIYDADNDGIIQGVVISYADATPELKTKNRVVLISKVSQTLDEDDMPAMEIETMDGRKYLIDSDMEATKLGGYGLIESQKKYNVNYARDLKTGDIIGIDLNAGGIDKFMFYMRLSDAFNADYFMNEKEDDATNWYISDGTRFGRVVLNPSEYPMLIINYDKNDASKRQYCYAEKSGSIYIYDTKRKTTTKANKSDILAGDLLFSCSGLFYIDAFVFVVR